MVFVLAATAFSCRKTPNTIGNNLIDGDNYIGVYHTNATSITCHSLLDSIGTKNVNYALLGSMKDPVFGNTQAGFTPSCIYHRRTTNSAPTRFLILWCSSSTSENTMVIQRRCKPCMFTK